MVAQAPVPAVGQASSCWVVGVSFAAVRGILQGRSTGSASWAACTLPARANSAVPPATAPVPCPGAVWAASSSSRSYTAPAAWERLPPAAAAGLYRAVSPSAPAGANTPLSPSSWAGRLSGRVTALPFRVRRRAEGWASQSSTAAAKAVHSFQLAWRRSSRSNSLPSRAVRVLFSAQ